MKKAILLSAALAMLSMTACADKSVTIIGGADGPTSVIVSEESAQADTTAEITETSAAEKTKFNEFKVGYSEIESYVIDDEKSMDFLDDAQKETFLRALVLKQEICYSFGPCMCTEGGYYNEQDYLWHSNTSYDSFLEYYNSIYADGFPEEYSDRMKNIDGELCLMDGGKGNITYMGGKYELVSKDDNTIRFKFIAENSYREVMTEEEFKENSLPGEQYEWTTETDLTMTKGSDGLWRVEKFELWV